MHLMIMASFSVLLTCALLAILQHACHAANPNLRMLFVSTSTYWFNYRHTNNALTLLESLSRGGENPNHKNTVVMIADDFECNVKSPAFQRYNESDVEISKRAAERLCNAEYKGKSVTPDSVLSVLMGRGREGLPATHRLSSPFRGAPSSLLLYITGHSGSGFIKFHDKEELSAVDLAIAIQTSIALGLYSDVWLLFDTCKAASLWGELSFPTLTHYTAAAQSNKLGVRTDKMGVMGLASSADGENSYAFGIDGNLGQSALDGFSALGSKFLATSAAKHRAGARGTSRKGIPLHTWCASLEGEGKKEKPAVCSRLKTPSVTTTHTPVTLSWLDMWNAIPNAHIASTVMPFTDLAPLSTILAAAGQSGASFEGMDDLAARRHALDTLVNASSTTAATQSIMASHPMGLFLEDVTASIRVL